MKKLFAIVLALALLVPMALTPMAKADEITAEPYYVLGWSDYDRDKFPYLEGLASSGIKNIGDKAILYYGGAQMMYGSYTDADVTKFAEAMKKEMESRPVGLRYWHFYAPSKALGLAPQNRIYLDFGVEQLKDLLTAALKKMKEIGCPLEGIVVDTEYGGLGSWYIYGDALTDKTLYKKIVDDPRYATEVRPLLVERGFKFYHKVTDMTPEIYSIHHTLGTEYEVSRSVWDTVMRLRLMDYLNEWCYEPLQTYYPEATMSDYQSTDTYAWLKGVTDAGDVVGSVAGNTSKGGNTSNYNFYANRPSSPFFKDGSGSKVFKNPPAYNEAVYEASPYNMFMYDMNLAKRMYVSTPTKSLSFWLCEHDYDTKQEGSVSNTPYYAEEILHLGLYDPQPFLGYIYIGAFLDENGKHDYEAYNKRLVPLNELMAELTRVAGYADKKPIEMPMSWNSEFMMTGMYVNGRNLWRITPNLDVVSKEAFKVEGADPTFSVAGQTVTFPGGKIIEDGNISITGTCGYWVETAKDVTPIVTNDADRFEKVPAYIEDFESYEIGTKLTTMNVRDENGWIVQAKGSDMLVEADGENKVLSVSGNNVLQSKQIPANVTLADSYAKEQAWELTVTIPQNMGGEFTFLNYTADKTPVKDGGYKISGGKISYSDNGTYKELSLDVSAGGKFTFQRVLNFEKYTCDYIVLDATGKEAASAKGVAIPSFNGKVATVDIICKKVTGKILLDNFILRALGMGADFAMYDAATGLRVSADKPNSGATAYRFSWANANATEKTATVMAAIYEGETLKEEKVLKEVKLQPGYDNVEYGIVEAAEGQSVKVYVKTDVKVTVEAPVVGPDATTPTTPATPTTPTNPTTPTTSTDPTAAPTESAPTQGNASVDGGSNPVVIIAVAVVAVAVVAVILALVLTKKKKK